MGAEQRASWTILVVDDNPGITLVLEHGLATCGYSVRTAAGANEALAQQAREGIDLVLTDVTLSGRNGVTLAKAMRVADPHLRVVFMSGYDRRDLEARGLELRDTQVLAKPFELDVLQRAIEADMRSADDATAANLTSG
jgi:two-component system cell cycle sensor histidine kinase/response regulator CckA